MSQNANTNVIHYVSNPIVGSNGVISPYFFVDTPTGARGVIRSSSALPDPPTKGTANSQAVAGGAPQVTVTTPYYHFSNPA